jgi:hypothetical protein
MAALHFRIGLETRFLVKSMTGPITGGQNPISHGLGGFSFRLLGNLFGLEPIYRHLQINPIHQGTRQLGPIIFPLARTTGAGLDRIAKITTGTGVSASHQGELGRESDGLAGAGNGDLAIF